jgi:hypothetical protein
VRLQPLQSPPSWVTPKTPAQIYISFERDTLYFSRWTSIKNRYEFLEYLEEKMKTMPKTVAFDLGHTGSTKDIRPFLPLQTRTLRVAETFILVLPTEIEGGRCKEIRFNASQCARLVQNMMPLELGLLPHWEGLLPHWEDLLLEPRSCNHLESFEAVGLELASFWGKSKALRIRLWEEYGDMGDGGTWGMAGHGGWRHG